MKRDTGVRVRTWRPAQKPIRRACRSATAYPPKRANAVRGRPRRRDGL